jgi:hypothetical protein
MMRLIQRHYDSAIRSPLKANELWRRIKSACFIARKTSIEGLPAGKICNVHGELIPSNYVVNSNQLYQISCLSRSLPLPSDEDCEREKEDFLQFVSVPAPRFRAKPYIESYNRFSVLSNRRLTCWSEKTDRIRLTKPDVNSHSACFGYSVKDGGRVQHFVDWTRSAVHNADSDFREPFAQERMRIFASEQRVSKSNLYSSEGQDDLLDEYLSYCQSHSERNRSEFVAVKVNGLKIRGVTKNPPERVVRAHQYRKKLFSILERTRGTKESLGELPTEFSLQDLNGAERVYSVDLKKATDGISHSFAEWICDKLDIPFDLVFEDFFVDGIKVSRGLFMGMPLSWCFLSMIHLLVCEFIDRKGNFFLKGDDLISVWTISQYELYRKILRHSGLMVNEKKTFVSRKRGTFCEALFELRGHKLVSIPNFSYAGLMRAGKEGIWIYDVETLAGTFVKRGLPRKRIFDVLEISFKHEFCLLSKAGIDLFEPKYLGGLGLPLEEAGQNLRNKNSIKYTQALYLGILDHKNKVCSPSSGSGPNSTFNERIISEVDYSFAVPKEQRIDDKLQSHFSYRRSVASIKDAQYAQSLRKKKISIRAQVKSLVRQRRFIFESVKNLTVETQPRSIANSRILESFLYAVPRSAEKIPSFYYLQISEEFSELSNV